jgi:hypothetical protein
VREQKIMSLEEAIRKSSSLPASTIGMTDRGLIALGLAADLTIFDSDTIIDRATYENPAVPSEGVRYVLVNGKIALKNGAATNVWGGRALLRSPNMPSRPATDRLRSLKVKGLLDGKAVAIDLTQRAGAREATGTFSIEGLGVVSRFGVLQIAEDWASVSFVNDGHAMVATVDLADPSPSSRRKAAVIVQSDGQPAFRGTLPATAVIIK